MTAPWRCWGTRLVVWGLSGKLVTSFSDSRSPNNGTTELLDGPPSAVGAVQRVAGCLVASPASTH